MYEHMESVTLGGKEYPIKCDINVLIEIQEQYDKLLTFEMLLIGQRMAVNSDGSIKMDENEKPIIETTEPSLRAIRTMLPCMLREAAESQKDTAPIDLSEADEAVKNARFDLYNTALSMYRELGKCLERKNVSSAESQEENRK